jgi:glycosyltransferase involved in cell wall biosynthesis
MKNSALPSGLVSVVIPTFNQANFLREALDSLIQQTHKEWEALVVNNFSTDHTIDVVNSYADQRMRIISFSNDGVIARSRNLGISLAQGATVAFLD